MKKLFLILPVLLMCCGSPKELSREEFGREIDKLSQVAEKSDLNDCSIVLLTLRASMAIKDEKTLSELCLRYALMRLKQIDELEKEINQESQKIN